MIFGSTNTNLYPKYYGNIINQLNHIRYMKSVKKPDEIINLEDIPTISDIKGKKIESIIEDDDEWSYVEHPYFKD